MKEKVEASIAVALAAAVSFRISLEAWRQVETRWRYYRVSKLVEDFQKACDTTVSELEILAGHMCVEMFAGLASKGGSRLRMLLTYVRDLPTGKVQGTYYVVDLGSTDLRILHVSLGGANSALSVQDADIRPIPQHLRTCTSKELFDFVATSLQDTIERKQIVGEQGIGFSFPFPVKNISSSSGKFIKWTKGFNVEDLVGKDVSQCLEEAMNRIGLNLRVSALINDTVGTLALGHFYDADTVAAVILGTGTNACYFEQSRFLVKCPSLTKTPGGMVVNIEWGNFSSIKLPRTSYDIDLDADSLHPSNQVFERMVSGMYLGEIVRRVILKILEVSDGLGVISSTLHEPFILSLHMIATMHSDDSPNLDEVARIFRDTLEISDVSLRIRKLVVIICDVVTRRAARLAAAGIVGILRKCHRDGTREGIVSREDIKEKGSTLKRTVVAVEGDLYTKYRMFKDYLDEALEKILGEDVAPYIIIKVVEDGPGIGAALLAACNTASSSGNTESSSGNTASSSGNTASSSGNTASSSGNTASSSGNTASSSGNTASSSGNTASSSESELELELFLAKTLKKKVQNVQRLCG